VWWVILAGATLDGARAAKVWLRGWVRAADTVNTAIKRIKRTSRGRRNNTHYSTCALFRSIRRAR